MGEANKHFFINDPRTIDTKTYAGTNFYDEQTQDENISPTREGRKS